jgi:hypothetical protein
VHTSHTLNCMLGSCHQAKTKISIMLGVCLVTPKISIMLGVCLVTPKIGGTPKIDFFRALGFYHLTSPSYMYIWVDYMYKFGHMYIWVDYSTKFFHVSIIFIFFLNRAGLFHPTIIRSQGH